MNTFDTGADTIQTYPPSTPVDITTLIPNTRVKLRWNGYAPVQRSDDGSWWNVVRINRKRVVVTYPYRVPAGLAYFEMSVRADQISQVDRRPCAN